MWLSFLREQFDLVDTGTAGDGRGHGKYNAPEEIPLTNLSH